MIAFEFNRTVLRIHTWVIRKFRIIFSETEILLNQVSSTGPVELTKLVIERVSIDGECRRPSLVHPSLIGTLDA